MRKSTNKFEIVGDILKKEKDLTKLPKSDII